MKAAARTSRPVTDSEWEKNLVSHWLPANSLGNCEWHYGTDRSQTRGIYSRNKDMMARSMNILYVLYSKKFNEVAETV